MIESNYLIFRKCKINSNNLSNDLWICIFKIVWLVWIMIKSVSRLFRFVAKLSRECLQKFNPDYICFCFDYIIKWNTKRDFDSTILSKIDQISKNSRNWLRCNRKSIRQTKRQWCGIQIYPVTQERCKPITHNGIPNQHLWLNVPPPPHNDCCHFIVACLFQLNNMGGGGIHSVTDVDLVRHCVL